LIHNALQRIRFAFDSLRAEAILGKQLYSEILHSLTLLVTEKTQAAIVIRCKFGTFFVLTFCQRLTEERNGFEQKNVELRQQMDRLLEQEKQSKREVLKLNQDLKVSSEKLLAAGDCRNTLLVAV